MSRISHLVTRLEKRGLVRRQPDPDDGRCTNAVLTDQDYAQVRRLLRATSPRSAS